MSPTVRDNPDQNRYEIYVDDELAGFGDYKRSPGRIAFTHTEVGKEFSGRGLARKLVADELADARQRGLGVLPFCPYVQQVIAKNPDKYLDLVPADQRARFKLPEGDAQ
ncbi:N-acetyltransferase [Ornithinimicrobium faecis]|uniref:N-acetyltransferase n=1 Tax=Ornithinimicrobium faecis TaxID=2934158 RepID=A0ABY4YYT9_9MICO|nr:GNAT family N-acetyltransferase [Ornithinimicrobium sp. HY1793]USQ81282.1 N-acetyltransferase [Ornithinimicrobium sp. HY1793]